MKNKVLLLICRLIEKYFIIKKNEILNNIKLLGDKVTIQEPFYFTGLSHIEIGNNVSIAAFVHIWGEGGIKIGNNVMIASHTAITSITHNPNNLLFNSENILQKVRIGNNVWIGSHSVIFPGVTIGDNCIIGAGSIVNKDIPSNSVFAGVPAKELYKLSQFN